MGILAGIGNIYFVYQFLKKLVTPFEKTKAFELGIIDEKGKILKKNRTLKKDKEKDKKTHKLRGIFVPGKVAEDFKRFFFILLCTVMFLDMRFFLGFL